MKEEETLSWLRHLLPLILLQSVESPTTKELVILARQKFLVVSISTKTEVYYLRKNLSFVKVYKPSRDSGQRTIKPHEAELDVHLT